MWETKELEESGPEHIQIEICDDNQRNKQRDEKNLDAEILRDDLNNNNLAGETGEGACPIQEEKDRKVCILETNPIIKMKSARNNITPIPAKIKKRVHFKDLGTKIKNNRDPLPMKLRALPHSFWQQPNNPASLSPAPLPPTASSYMATQRNDDLEVAQSNNTRDNSPTSTPNTNTNIPSPSSPEAEENSTVSDANTELLFSLFNTINNDTKKFKRRRGRPKKISTPMCTAQARDDDPCLVPSGPLPFFPHTQPQLDTPKTFNYSQLLNDLVFQL